MAAICLVIIPRPDEFEHFDFAIGKRVDAGFVGFIPGSGELVENEVGHAGGEENLSVLHLAQSIDEDGRAFSLVDESQRTGANRPLCEERLVVHRGDQHFNVGVLGFDFLDEFDTAAVTERDIDDDEIGFEFIDPVSGLPLCRKLLRKLSFRAGR